MTYNLIYYIWLTCFRSRRDADKRNSSNAGDLLHDFEQDVSVTSESDSWAADERAWSSDNPNTSVMKGREPRKRYIFES